MNRGGDSGHSSGSDAKAPDTVSLPTARAADVTHPDRPETDPSVAHVTHVRRGLRERLLQYLSADDRARVLESTHYTADSDPIWVPAYAAIAAIESSVGNAAARVDDAAESVRDADVRIRRADDGLADFRDEIRAEAEAAFADLTEQLKMELRRQHAKSRQVAGTAIRKGVVDVLSRRWVMLSLGFLIGTLVANVPNMW
jgi:hypothetical protein